jgi:DNA-binding transcriptional LysR family regulator
MFKNMEYVYEVYKEKSFSKAAKKLYISQPALSLTIKKMEESIGHPIFDRSTNPISLTECGNEYIKCIREIMDLEEGFQNYLEDLSGLKTGKLTIGSNHIYASYILPLIMAEFTKKYPLIEVKLLEANTALLEKELLSGTLDLVIDNYDFDEKICTKHFAFHEHLILMAHKSFLSNETAKEYSLSLNEIRKEKHLKKDTKAVPLQLFKDEPFVLLKSGNDSRTRANRMCQNSAFTPKVVIEVDQLATAYNIAGNGMGITFISDTLANKASLNQNVLFYKLEDTYAMRDVYFYYKTNKYFTRAMEEFLSFANRMVNPS